MVKESNIVEGEFGASAKVQNTLELLSSESELKSPLKILISSSGRLQQKAHDTAKHQEQLNPHSKPISTTISTSSLQERMKQRLEEMAAKKRTLYTEKSVGSSLPAKPKIRMSELEKSVQRLSRPKKREEASPPKVWHSFVFSRLDY